MTSSNSNKEQYYVSSAGTYSLVKSDVRLITLERTYFVYSSAINIAAANTIGLSSNYLHGFTRCVYPPPPTPI